MSFPGELSYVDFGGNGPPAHFAHANGYPPRAYRQLLQGIATKNHVIAMLMRPLWPGAEPRSISHWRPLADDLACFLDQLKLDQIVGWGHSMGATTTLRLALRAPERFKALVLIDPVLIPPYLTILWDLIYRLGLSYHVLPWVKGALKRRNHFESRAAMYTNYRQKAVFKRMSDTALMDYVDALACPRQDGSIDLCYSASWEARLYVTGLRADLDIWRALPRLKAPLLIIRGAETDTFWESTARGMQHRLPSIHLHTVPDATHLVALEKPNEVLALANKFLQAL